MSSTQKLELGASPAPEGPPPAEDPRPSPLLRAAQSLHATLGTVGLGLLVALVAEIVVFSMLSPYFFAADNFTDIGRALTITGIAAIGQTIVIISRGFDLSVGSVMAVSAMVVAYVISSGGGLLLAAVACLAMGLVVGITNGVIVSYMRINPLIATLATLSIVRGLAYIVSDGESKVIENATLSAIGTDDFLGIPIVVWGLLVLVAGFGLLIPRSRFGRYMYAIGSNPRAARLSGVPVSRWRLSFYAVSGTMAAIAGFVAIARTGQADPSAYIGAELDVITVVILGGASLAGGRGSILGMFLGLLVLGVLNNGLILAGVEPYWQQVVRGAVLLAAVLYDERRRSMREES